MPLEQRYAFSPVARVRELLLTPAGDRPKLAIALWLAPLAIAVVLRATGLGPG